ncbi:hypothetical protein CEXT_625621 [Caerostris extrusa]|uniref:Uncharacterized protein n=1 Tax=Caerostris extrusa TaxID=172846 RepID=A0AAV4XKG3_CAEEX|nr:hypothetical protein CEXT_625621 [Caerostris extrusa]
MRYLALTTQQRNSLYGSCTPAVNLSGIAVSSLRQKSALSDERYLSFFLYFFLLSPQFAEKCCRRQLRGWFLPWTEEEKKIAFISRMARTRSLLSFGLWTVKKLAQI